MTAKEPVIPNFPVIATAVLTLGLSERITERKDKVKETKANKLQMVMTWIMIGREGQNVRPGE